MAGQPITAEQREQCVEATAGRLHDAWRELRRLPDGGYEPRLKSDGFGGQVDIANTDFAHLPAKWQAENRAAAVAVVDLILSGPDTDDEDLAAAVHDDWLSRNAEWAPPEQSVPFAELGAQDQEKDRAVVATARDVIAGIVGQPDEGVAL